MFPPNLWSRLVFVAPVFLLIPGTTCGAFEIISHAAFTDAVNQRVLFEVTFNEPPNFFDTDPEGNPVNAFQYWYDSAPGDDEFTGEDVVVIRGPEIRLKNAIPLRESLNPTGEDFPGAEGWGPIRGLVPYEVDSNTLTFAAAWDELGEADENFSYRLMAFQAGELTSDLSSAVVIPLPMASGAGVVGLAIVYSCLRKSTSSGVCTRRPLSD